jgi:hypothetical protein
MITAWENCFAKNETAYYLFINFKIIKQYSTGDLPVSLQDIFFNTTLVSKACSS